MSSGRARGGGGRGLRRPSSPGPGNGSVSWDSVDAGWRRYGGRRSHARNNGRAPSAGVHTGDQLSLTAADLAGRTLGPATISSPLAGGLLDRRDTVHYVAETDRVLLDDTLDMAARRGVPTCELPRVRTRRAPVAAVLRAGANPRGCGHVRGSLSGTEQCRPRARAGAVRPRRTLQRRVRADPGRGRRADRAATPAASFDGRPRPPALPPPASMAHGVPRDGARRRQIGVIPRPSAPTGSGTRQADHEAEGWASTRSQSPNGVVPSMTGE